MATIAASGPINFSDIRTVMGGSGEVTLGNYRQDTSPNYTKGVSGVPATGAISVSAFSGKTRALLPGLMYRIFSGYYYDDTAYFDSRTETTMGLTTDTTNISTGTGGNIAVNGADNYSVEWYGFFYANVTGTWTFYTASDDSSYLWLGASALSGYTTSNTLVNNGGLHGLTEKSGTVTLTAGQYYPIRIQFGELGGGDDCQVSFTPPGGTRTYNGAGYYFFGLGTNSALPGINARCLKALWGTVIDAPYWINVNGTSTSVFCLMNGKWDGGGWMMMMKATRGNTFEFNSNYWTTANTLNSTDVTRNDADAKYNTMNYSMVKDVMALWPDVGYTGGSVSQTEAWSWLVNNFFSSGTRTTILTGFSAANSRDSPVSPDPTAFNGFSTNIWSSQTPAKKHVFGGGTHINTGSYLQLVRWGFLFNENAANDFNSIDALGGIGINSMYGGRSHSAGDVYGCCGVAGLNRSMRVELYGR